MGRTSQQRVVTLALKVLSDAAYRAQTQPAGTVEVRLALAVLWLLLRDRAALTAYWERVQRRAATPWETCHHHYHGVCHALREEGWDAPV